MTHLDGTENICETTGTGINSINYQGTFRNGIKGRAGIMRGKGSSGQIN